MGLDPHERSPDAACVKRSLTRIHKSVCILDRAKNHIFLTEVGEVLNSSIHIPSLETTGHLRIKKRIYRGPAVLVEEISFCILKILHKVVNPA